ncbi:very short patch repair endonuclease [[Empedobacter] haloabium]|uniref:Very short patch repair endonuclease n=1 Tax=[Empedobacter] haloabium TaxID=592317 RepID=A0ABZ1UI97_9BURK
MAHFEILLVLEKVKVDKLSPIARSHLMAKVRNSNTLPELQLRRAMWTIEIRFRLGQRIGRTQPDIVFKRARLAIFIDGCFWHSCPIHGSRPKSNQRFWEKKLTRNVARDRKTTTDLESAEWVVMRFWEHEVDQDAFGCARKIAKLLGKSSTGNLRQ